MTRLEDYYRDTVVPALSEQFKYMSIMQVPRVQKITLNMGVGEALVDKNVLEAASTISPRSLGKNLSSQRRGSLLRRLR